MKNGRFSVALSLIISASVMLADCVAISDECARLANRAFLRILNGVFSTEGMDYGYIYGKKGIQRTDNYEVLIDELRVLRQNRVRFRATFNEVCECGHHCMEWRISQFGGELYDLLNDGTLSVVFSEEDVRDFRAGLSSEDIGYFTFRTAFPHCVKLPCAVFIPAELSNGDMRMVRRIVGSNEVDFIRCPTEISNRVAGVKPRLMPAIEHEPHLTFTELYNTVRKEGSTVSLRQVRCTAKARVDDMGVCKGDDGFKEAILVSKKTNPYPVKFANQDEEIFLNLVNGSGVDEMSVYKFRLGYIVECMFIGYYGTLGSEPIVVFVPKGYSDVSAIKRACGAGEKVRLSLIECPVDPALVAAPLVHIDDDE
ncbi:MAG: hypothetical protein LBB21_03790 [Holosporaceae bacterium]|jgi:hypothetical protein|nr:hypothetical protein [Holosporaceae bacterium]